MSDEIEWRRNDSLFKRELSEGKKWQDFVGEYLSNQKLNVVSMPLTFRESIDQARQFINTIDLQINGRVIVEVKSRREVFDSPESFPYDTVFVDSVSGYDGKIKKPHAYIMVSQITEAMMALPGLSAKGWQIETKFDRIRRIKDDFYLAPKGKFSPIEELVRQLKEQTE